MAGENGMCPSGLSPSRPPTHPLRVSVQSSAADARTAHKTHGRRAVPNERSDQLVDGLSIAHVCLIEHAPLPPASCTSCSVDSAACFPDDSECPHTSRPSQTRG